mgnify:CR=1 FL=1
MSSHRLPLIIAMSASLLATACGGGDDPPPLPPLTGQAPLVVGHRGPPGDPEGRIRTVERGTGGAWPRADLAIRVQQMGYDDRQLQFETADAVALVRPSAARPAPIGPRQCQS